MNFKHTMERIYLTRSDLDSQENSARYWRHIERYIAIRSRVYGHVLDLACGVGYGSYILSKNPEVDHVHGVDINEEVIGFANSEYKTDKTSYFTNTGDVGRTKFDCLVSIETIEHIEDKLFIPITARFYQIPRLIISYPHIKSTHFNKFHHHDFNTQQICDLFDEWLLVSEEKIHHDVTILEFVADPKEWRVERK